MVLLFAPLPVIISPGASQRDEELSEGCAERAGGSLWLESRADVGGNVSEPRVLLCAIVGTGGVAPKARGCRARRSQSTERNVVSNAVGWACDSPGLPGRTRVIVPERLPNAQSPHRPLPYFRTGRRVCAKWPVTGYERTSLTRIAWQVLGSSGNRENQAIPRPVGKRRVYEEHDERMRRVASEDGSIRNSVYLDGSVDSYASSHAHRTQMAMTIVGILSMGTKN
jgi:hypothetical protein